MNVFVRDMDLHDFNRLDGRRLEVAVDGSPLWNGAQLAIDTTMVSPVRRDGTAAGTAMTNGKATPRESRRKTAGPVWLSWALKLAAGGQLKRSRF